MFFILNNDLLVYRSMRFLLFFSSRLFGLNNARGTRFRAKHVRFPAAPNENLFAAAGEYLRLNDGMDYPRRRSAAIIAALLLSNYNVLDFGAICLNERA